MAQALEILKARYTGNREDKAVGFSKDHCFESRFELILVCYVSHLW